MKEINEMRRELVVNDTEFQDAKNALKEVLTIIDGDLTDVTDEEIKSRRENYSTAKEKLTVGLNDYVDALLVGVKSELSKDVTLLKLAIDGNVNREVEHIVRRVRGIVLNNKTVKTKKKLPSNFDNAFTSVRVNVVGKHIRQSK